MDKIFENSEKTLKKHDGAHLLAFWEQLADARKQMVEAVKPAYLRLIAELETEAAIAPDADGVWRFEDGDAFYAERLNWYTGTNLTADEIHNIGLREVARIHSEIEVIMEKVDFEGTASPADPAVMN